MLKKGKKGREIEKRLGIKKTPQRLYLIMQGFFNNKRKRKEKGKKKLYNLLCNFNQVKQNAFFYI